MLESENRCLQKIMGLSEGLLNASSSQSSVLKGVDLDLFSLQREKLFKTLQLLDQRINQVASDRKKGPALPEAIDTSIRNLLNQKTQLVEAVLQQDQKVIAKIREAQEQLSKEILSSNRSIERVARFKSNWINESGRNLDGTL